MIHEETAQDSEEDPFEVEQRMKWQEEEEKARADNFRMIEEYEKRGLYMITVAQMIEDESAAKKKKRDIEKRKKTNLRFVTLGFCPMLCF